MSTISKLIKPMFGKTCCKTRVGEYRSFKLGFGDKIYHGKPKLIDDFNGEWEIGTYYRSWRILQEGKVICGCNDPVDSNEELDAAVKRITFGRIISITQEPSDIDIRATFDTGIVVDFLSTVSGDDESFHIFCPEHMCATFDAVNGWLIGKSNKPWKKLGDSGSA